jgi:hypothetical protein
MCVECRPLVGRGVPWRLSLCVISVLLLGGGAASAADATVNCPDSINAALAGFDKEVPNGVTISGTCTEAVVVDGFKELSLNAGAPGAGIVRPVAGSGEPEYSALTIRESGVSINGLTFEGPGLFNYSPPLISVSRSSLYFDGCTIQGGEPAGGLDVKDHSNISMQGTSVANNATGMSFQGDSEVWIMGTTVTDNGTGIAAGSGSHVQLSMWWGDPNTIENNNNGISADRGALVEVGLATIRNNGQGAVSASNGAVVNLGAWGWGAVSITGNGSGDPNDPKYPNNPLPAVVAADGGIVWIIQPTTIEGNHGSGAHASRNGELYVCCGATADDISISGNGGFGFDVWIGGGLFFWGPALVEGNVRGGIAVDSGEAFLNLGALVRGNGDSTDPDSYGGLQVDDNATVYTAATVIANDGPGVFVSAGATVLFQPGAVIADNFGYGVELEAAATATFSDGVTVTGNRAFDLVCSSGSVAGAPQGMHPVIGRKRCPTWTQLRGYPAWLEALLEP